MKLVSLRAGVALFGTGLVASAGVFGACIDVSGLEGSSSGTTGTSGTIDADGSKTDSGGSSDDSGSEGSAPVSDAAIKCVGSGSTIGCGGATPKCCIENGTPRCAAPEADCQSTATILVCDEQDDCPLQTKTPPFPANPLYCCFLREAAPEGGTRRVAGCVRDTTCEPPAEFLCNPSAPNPCQRSGGSCTGKTADGYDKCK